MDRELERMNQLMEEGKSRQRVQNSTEGSGHETCVGALQVEPKLPKRGEEVEVEEETLLGRRPRTEISDKSNGILEFHEKNSETAARNWKSSENQDNDITNRKPNCKYQRENPYEFDSLLTGNPKTSSEKPQPKTRMSEANGITAYKSGEFLNHEFDFIWGLSQNIYFRNSHLIQPRTVSTAKYYRIVENSVVLKKLHKVKQKKVAEKHPKQKKKKKTLFESFLRNCLNI